MLGIKNKKNLILYIISIAVIPLIIFLDLLTKSIAEKKLIPGFTVINGVFDLRYSENTGGGLSIFPGKITFFVIVTAISLLIFTYFFIKLRNDRFLGYFSIALIIGGAIGNFYDRIVFKYVRDFIDFRPINFANFNIADMALTIGCCLLIIYLLFLSEDFAVFGKKSKENKKSVATENTENNNLID